ncbi:DUF411 domain-containing protein [Neisseria dentiae]|uniref:DUF411 domain-containing protein n=1 Tax=Neisseria dentiae TaxID=194197 RepID=UPI0035A0D40A
MNLVLYSRRFLLQTFLGVAAAVAVPAVYAQAAAVVNVWKDPNCGCCNDWIKHMQQHGFKVNVHQNGNSDMRRRLGMPQKFASCHTATVGRYVLEGHVPAADVRRLLREKPVAVGLAVPGMPIGSPGMDGAVYGGKKTPYNVLLVKRDGNSSVFQTY